MLLFPFQDTYILKQHPDHLCLCFNFLKIWGDDANTWKCIIIKVKHLRHFPEKIRRFSEQLHRKATNNYFKISVCILITNTLSQFFLVIILNFFNSQSKLPLNLKSAIKIYLHNVIWYLGLFEILLQYFCDLRLRAWV